MDICKSYVYKRRGGIEIEEVLAFISDEDDENEERDEQNENGDAKAGGTDSNSKQVTETKSRVKVKTVKTYETLDKVIALPDVKNLKHHKLLSMYDIMEAWKTPRDGEEPPTELALQTTQQILIQMLRDFCVWNTLEDEQMRIVLEKNAIAKLIDMDVYFRPVQKKMEFIVDEVCDLTGESAATSPFARMQSRFNSTRSLDGAAPAQPE